MSILQRQRLKIKKLKDAGIGTYVLFQETYHQSTYEKMHPQDPSTITNGTPLPWIVPWKQESMMGLGVLYGLYDYQYDTVAMIMHAEHLDQTFGVGPHTISQPRLRAAAGVDIAKFPYLVSDSDFKKIVAVIRLTVPYTGMILSTREEPKFREEVMAVGISQISAGSCTGVGGYVEEYENPNKRHSDEKPQFEVEDHRSPMEILKSLCNSGYIPSYCTACYREGRTGERFMPCKIRPDSQCMPSKCTAYF